MIVDEPRTIERLDLSRVVASLERFPEQCDEAIALGRKFATKIKKPGRVFVCGMGGSGIAGDILAGLFPDKEIRVFKGYDLPEYVLPEDVIFCLSYSGNTEETLSVFREAVKRKCKAIAITSGGDLEKECAKHNVPLIKIPKGIKPRFALGYLLMPMVVILEKAGFIEKQKLDLVVKNLKETREEIKISTPAKDNPAKRIALKLLDSVPVVHGFGIYEPVAYRARTQFNENAKIPSFSETFPELNHNSILGWQDGSLGKGFSVLIIRDNRESEQMRKRIDFTKQLIKKAARSVIEVWSIYPYAISRVLSTMYVLDFATVYLGLLRGKDPGDDSLLAELKTILKGPE